MVDLEAMPGSLFYTKFGMADTSNDLDAQIARLEAELQRDNSSDSDLSDAEDCEYSSSSVVLSTPLDEDDIIPPLPKALLPTSTSNMGKKGFEISDDEAKVKMKKKKKNEKKKEGVANDQPMPVVPRAVKQQELMQYIRGYKPSERIPFACRLCAFQGSGLADLEAHRSSLEHAAAVEREAKAARCKLCRIGFTSPVQLREHLKGKAHKDTLLRRSDPAAFRAQLTTERAALVTERDARRAARTSSQGVGQEPAPSSHQDSSTRNIGVTRVNGGVQSSGSANDGGGGGGARKQASISKEKDGKGGSKKEHDAHAQVAVSESLEASVGPASSSRKRIRSALRLDLIKKRGELPPHGIDSITTMRQSKKSEETTNDSLDFLPKQIKKNKKARKDISDKQAIIFEDFASDSASEIDGIFDDLSD